MLFRRRKKADLLERARTFFWPRRSFLRSAQYFIKRVLRLSATPHAIAAGVAAGVFASFTPFLGFHFVIAAGLASPLCAFMSLSPPRCIACPCGDIRMSSSCVWMSYTSLLLSYRHK